MAFSFLEMEEIKTELNRARTHSARLREEVRLMRTGLENEQQNHRKTQKELKELKSIHETLMVRSNDDQRILQAQVKELENKIKTTEEELSAKEVFVEETDRLRKMCDKLDDDLRNLRENFEKTSEENKELAKKLSGYQNNTLNQSNSPDMTSLMSMQVGLKIYNGHEPNFHLIGNADEEMKLAFRKNRAISTELLDEARKDLANVTKEREDLKQKYEELERQLEDTLESLERKRSASFHDRATSPREMKQDDSEGKLVKYICHCGLYFILIIVNKRGRFFTPAFFFFLTFLSLSSRCYHHIQSFALRARYESLVARARHGSLVVLPRHGSLAVRARHRSLVVRARHESLVVRARLLGFTKPLEGRKGEYEFTGI